MSRRWFASSALAVVTSLIALPAYAGFVSYVVTSSHASYDEQDLVVYTVAARFDGPMDTVFRAFDLSAANSAWFTGFWHKDSQTDDLSEAPLSQASGSWNPRRTGSATLNRPYDSYLVIGGTANSVNTTVDQTEDIIVAQFMSSGWDHPWLPSSANFEWLNQNPGNLQGRVGNSSGLPSTDVRIGQFVLSAGHEARTFSLSLEYTIGQSFDGDGDGNNDYLYGTGTFTLGEPVPAPGVLSLLAAAGAMLGRRRR